jgi:hypothetical protein
MALRGTTQNNGTTSTTSNSITYAGASNIVIGDFIVLVSEVTTSSTESFTDPSGFTAGSSISLPDVRVNASDYLHVAVKIAAAGDVGTPTYVTSCTNGGYWKQQLRVYSGRNTATVGSAITAVSATGAATQGGYPYSFAMTGLTAASGDDLMLFAVGCLPDGNSGSTAFGASATGFSNSLASNYSGYQYDASLNSLDYVNYSGGTTGTITVTLTQTGGSGTQVIPFGFMLSLANAVTTPFTPFTQTQFFVTDTIIQQ